MVLASCVRPAARSERAGVVACSKRRWFCSSFMSAVFASIFSSEPQNHRLQEIAASGEIAQRVHSSHVCRSPKCREGFDAQCDHGKRYLSRAHECVFECNSASGFFQVGGFWQCGCIPIGGECALIRFCISQKCGLKLDERLTQILDRLRWFAIEGEAAHHQLAKSAAHRSREPGRATAAGRGRCSSKGLKDSPQSDGDRGIAVLTSICGPIVLR